MNDLDRLQRAFLAADQKAQAGDAQAREDARMFASEIRRLQAEGARPAAEPQGPGLMGRLNEGIARGLGAPVDFLASGLSSVGIGSGDAFGGSESIKRGMQSIGIPLPEKPPETMLERFMGGVGEGAGFLLPVGAVARGMQSAGPLASAMGNAIMRPFVSTPAAAIGTEMAAGGGAAVGSELARQNAPEGYEDVAGAFGGLAGGLAGAMGPGLAMRGTSAAVQSTPVAGTAIRAAKAAIVPFTEAGGRVRASDRLRSLSADPEGQAAALANAPISDISPAVQTGDPNLIALERSILERNPALRDEFQARQRQAGVSLREAARAPAGGYGIADARAFIEQRRNDFIAGMQSRIEEARNAATQAIQRLSPARAQGENSAIVRRELDRAYNDAASIERDLWRTIDRSVTVGTSTARRVLADIDADTPRAQKSDIYADAKRFLSEDGEFGDAESVREMHGLYSRLRRDAREAIAGPVPNENRARISNLLADAIWEDMTDIAGPVRPEVANQLAEAREYSRVFNEAFSQGTVGDILSQARTGAARVAPEMTLGVSVGRGGTAGAVGSQQIREAVDFPALPEAKRGRATATVSDAVQDFLREGIRRAAQPGGAEFRTPAAAEFATRNQELLRQYPQLAGQLDDAIRAAQGQRQAETGTQGRVAALQDPRRSVGAAVEAARPGAEIERAIFGARNPLQAAREIKRQAARDASGVADRGLKGGFVDYMMGRARTGTADVEGNPVISGNSLFEMLKDRQTRAIASTVLGGDELTRLEAIAREFQMLERARSSRDIGDPMNDMPNKVISLMAGTLAARAGAQLGAGTSGASLRTANLATQAVNKALGTLTNDKAEALLRDAIQDRELFRALLMPANTTERARQIERRLTEWAIGYTATVAAGENE